MTTTTTGTKTRPDTRHKMRLVCVLFTFENNTGRTYGRTDGRTETTSYRDATAHLKTSITSTTKTVAALSSLNQRRFEPDSDQAGINRCILMMQCSERWSDEWKPGHVFLLARPFALCFWRAFLCLEAHLVPLLSLSVPKNVTVFVTFNQHNLN